MDKKFFFFPIIVFLILLVGYLLFNKSPFKIDTSHASVIKEIRQLEKLETASYTIEKIIDAGTNGNAFQELLYGDKILLIAHGQVVAGFDLSNISDKDIQLSGNSITIHLPPPQILYSRIDNEKTKVYDRRQGILSKGDKDLESEARASAEKSIQQAACEAGILKEASNNAEKQIKTMLVPFGFTEVTIQIPEGKC